MPGSRAWRKLSEDVNFIKRIGYQDRCSIKVTTATPCGLYFPICYMTLSSRADQNSACRMRGKHQSKLKILLFQNFTPENWKFKQEKEVCRLWWAESKTDVHSTRSAGEDGWLSSHDRVPRMGTFDLQGKEQKIPRGRGEKGFFHGEWYSQRGAENSKAYTVNR